MFSDWKLKNRRHISGGRTGQAALVSRANLKIVFLRHSMSFWLGVEVRSKSNYVVASTVAGLSALKLLVRASLFRPLARAPQSEYARAVDISFLLLCFFVLIFARHWR
jgi:hypothetical protein